MRMSCNGCRVLRKGCSEDCVIRPCLQWIASSDAQANATLFLAKFYGRAGLINLIEAGPLHLRPAIFRSLLYEACGRIVNPVHGSVGLLWSGNWTHCQAAVDSVLKGTEIVQLIPPPSSIPFNVPTAPAPHLMPTPMKNCDIRHVSNKDPTNLTKLGNQVKDRVRFKRSVNETRPNSRLLLMGRVMKNRVRDCKNDDESLLSVETVVGEPEQVVKIESRIDENSIDLELSLGVV